MKQPGICALVVAAIVVRVASQSTCLDTDKEVDCPNCDFTNRADILRVKKNSRWEDGYGYYITNPDSWACGKSDGNCILAFSGNQGYGARVKTQTGNPYLILSCKGASIHRTFTGLVAGREYVISFFGAERIGYGSGEQIKVSVNAVEMKVINPTETFVENTVTVQPNQKGVIVLEFENAAPSADSGGHPCGDGGDQSVFIADVDIHMVRDCGAGASCHNPIPPQKSYTCRCDGGATFGRPKVGGVAVCTAKDDLPERLGAVEDLAGTVEKGVEELVSTVNGLQQTFDSRGQRVDDDTAVMQGKLADVVKDVVSVKADVAGLKTQLDSVQAELSALLSGLRALNAVPPSALTVPAEPDPAPGASTPPEIVASAGTIDFVVQEGRRASVNGKSILTADDTKQLIEKAVLAALKAVADGV